jgi:hypothetical protein
LAFGVWRLAFGVWRLAFGVWRLAFGVWRLAFGVWRLASFGAVATINLFIVIGLSYTILEKSASLPRRGFFLNP